LKKIYNYSYLPFVGSVDFPMFGFIISDVVVGGWRIGPNGLSKRMQLRLFIFQDYLSKAHLKRY
jgi:hypothetical protein